MWRSRFLNRWRSWAWRTPLSPSSPCSGPSRSEMPGVDVEKLLGLWHGDESSLGYQCEEIVVAVCEQSFPRTFDAIRLKFYPALSEKQIPPDELDMLRDGYALWQKRGS